jgi:hypothetical protein
MRTAGRWRSISGTLCLLTGKRHGRRLLSKSKAELGRAMAAEALLFLFTTATVHLPSRTFFIFQFNPWTSCKSASISTEFHRSPCSKCKSASILPEIHRSPCSKCKSTSILPEIHRSRASNAKVHLFSAAGSILHPSDGNSCTFAGSTVKIRVSLRNNCTFAFR